MSGFFGVASKRDCVLDLFFGVDYHSHLGTRRAGMTVHGETGFNRAIHNIQNSPFRTKFERDIEEFHGNLGIGCISDNEAQPLLVNSHLGSFAITTVGRINNLESLKALCFNKGTSHFLEMSSGEINPTELVAALINHKQSIVEGISYVQEMVEGSMSILVMTKEGIYAARDKLGRTPVIIGEKEDGYCITFESSAFLNLGYHHYRDLGPGEIDFITPQWVEVVKGAGEEMRICSFLWVYYGYPTSTYEGVNVECMRNRCGDLLAQHDERSDIHIDSVAGVPDSGLPSPRKHMDSDSLLGTVSVFMPYLTGRLSRKTFATSIPPKGTCGAACLNLTGISMQRRNTMHIIRIPRITHGLLHCLKMLLPTKPMHSFRS